VGYSPQDLHTQPSKLVGCSPQGTNTNITASGAQPTRHTLAQNFKLGTVAMTRNASKKDILDMVRKCVSEGGDMEDR